jgi:hypothetical protein
MRELLPKPIIPTSLSGCEWPPAGLRPTTDRGVRMRSVAAVAGYDVRLLRSAVYHAVHSQAHSSGTRLDHRIQAFPASVYAV